MKFRKKRKKNLKRRRRMALSLFQVSKCVRVFMMILLDV